MDRRNEKKLDKKGMKTKEVQVSSAKPCHSFCLDDLSSSRTGTSSANPDPMSREKIEEFIVFIMEIRKLNDVIQVEPKFAKESLRVIALYCDLDEIKNLLKYDELLCAKMAKYLTRAVITLLDPIKKELQAGKNPALYNNNEVREKITAAFAALTNFFGANSHMASQIATYADLIQCMYPFWFHRIYDPFEALPYGVLVNLTRPPGVCTHYTKSGFLKVQELVARSVQFPSGSLQLPGIMEVLQNLSQIHEARLDFFDRKNAVLEKVVLRLKPTYTARVRTAVAGTLKNLSFEEDCHHILVDEKLDVLSYAIRPIVGKGEYDEEERHGMPPLLWADLLENKEMERDSCIEIRGLVLDFLYRLCSQREIRESLRKQNVYCLLREYHKWEQNEELVDSVERVVNLLVQTEDEIGADNLGALKIN